MRILLCLATVVLIFSVAQAEIELNDITISKHENSIYIDVTTSKPCLYEHFMIKEAPEKIVVDLKGTVNNWPKKKFLNLPLKSIERVRTSQYQVSPELITRVVFDVNRPLSYTVEQLPMGLRIIIPAVESEQAFIPWKAGQQLKQLAVLAEKEKPKVKPAKAKKKTSTTRKPKVKIESFPKRKLVKYKAGGKRDPFKPLVGTGSATFMSGDVPAIENLSLVGIFDDETGSRALFEDAEGNGYLLKPNDRVQNGYLVSIQNNKAIFQVTEYGWTRTVALNLEFPE